MNHTLSKFLTIAGYGAIGGPFLMLVSDIFRNLTGRNFEWTIGLWLAFVLLIPGLIGFAYVLVESGRGLAIVGGALAVFGAIAGASMQVLFRVHAVLTEQGSTQTVEQLRQTFKLVASTQMIGITFPIGLLVLAYCLWKSFPEHWIPALLLVGGAIAFPIGRIGELAPAVIVSGILLTAAFAIIGQHVILRRAHAIAE